ncbi:MAG: NAD-binding protein [Candidatus Paceibacterota bacterium]
MEMGQALALLGSQVTIATIDESLAAREDSVVAPKIEASFEALGITILHCAHIEHVDGRQASLLSNEAVKW